jgi:hypothetical protein
MKTEAVETSRTNAPSWFTTSPGIVRAIHDREAVSYAAKYAGTIVVTGERYLYFVLGEGKAFATTSVERKGILGLA